MFRKGVDAAGIEASHTHEHGRDRPYFLQGGQLGIKLIGAVDINAEVPRVGGISGFVESRISLR